MVTVAEVARRSESRGGSRSASSPFPRELHPAYPGTWLGEAPRRPDPTAKVCVAWPAGAGAAPERAGRPLRRTMPLVNQRVPDESGYSLVASLDNVRNLSTVLKAIHFRDHATCFATKNGIKAGIFQEFKVQEEPVTFRINLTVLLDCLSIFGSSPMPGTLTALRMCYQGYGCPLMLFLEEGGVVTVCKINTQEPEETLDFDFCSTNVINKIILQSEGLREAFSELDMTSEVLQITMSPDKPYFRLSTFGNAGSSHLDYPKDSDLMESFNCNETQVNRYKISLLKPSTKALVLSCKVSIRTDNRGFLSLQYMIRNEDGQICFVEYYCCPDEEVPDSES
ncbi:cell cycle checkpoint protein RAD1 isoform X2 [Eptesicus fuscus]|uniref:cell cycle checkpoint protein RAD1 isoform X2 n=1 Tax=Eptesicus fuscus TaxID=29078 RepID=UPI0024046871|nr:cell cycle checkpoint protein RAD1 isoform X2 [Eptesicus fuscus]